MSKSDSLRAGQEVFLRRPVQIYARVIGPCESDLGSGEAQECYLVQLIPMEQCYSADDLELSCRAVGSQPQVASIDPRQIEKRSHSRAVPKISATESFDALKRMIDALVADRAYELYESRGCANGYDGEDWLRAESEILASVSADVSETDALVTVRADLSGFSETDLEVFVTPNTLCISGRQGVSQQAEESRVSPQRRSHRIFALIDLPSGIDPQKAEASWAGPMLEARISKFRSRETVPALIKSASA